MCLAVFDSVVLGNLSWNRSSFNSRMYALTWSKLAVKLGKLRAKVYYNNFHTFAILIEHSKNYIFDSLVFTPVLSTFAPY